MNETDQVKKVAVLIPTRGLIYGKTLESLFKSKIEKEFIIVSGLPIPEAQNEMVRRALETDCSLFLMVEDDTVIPDGALEKMIEMNCAMVCVDYPVINGWSTIKKKDGEILHCGLGCTLIKRSVFEKLEEPWFITDKSLDADTGEIKDIPMKYGGHDIFFGIKLREAGYKINQLEGFECEHLRCSDLNRREYNNGTYQIYALDKVSKYQNN